MTPSDPDLSIAVSLADDSRGSSDVRLDISGALPRVICVRPEQARRLALDLVQAVQRLDIRIKLRQPEAIHVHPTLLEQCAPAQSN
jgi:hypothetical protein